MVPPLGHIILALFAFSLCPRFRIHYTLHIVGVQDIIKRIQQKSGLGNIKFTAHVFRHTFAKEYLAKGGEIFKLSREMGHSDIQVTKKYLEDFNSSDARKDHTAFSPVSDIKLKKKHRRKQKQEAANFQYTFDL